MSEMMESARRWTGYVCPDCRFVFRVPRDHDGAGVVCPSCRRMLKIPVTSDTLPALVSPLRRKVADESESEAGTPVLKKRRRGKKLGSSADHAWEQQPVSSHAGRHEGGQRRQLWIGGSVLVVLIGVGVFFSLKSGEKSAVTTAPALPIPVDVVKKPELVNVMRSEASIVAEAEPLARQFLEAKTVAGLLPLIRHPEITEPRMQAVYPDGKIEAPGLSKFNSSEGVSTRGKLISMMVRTSEQVERPLAFIETPQGLRIDWESWAGWSEIPWEKFLATRATTAKMFRVTLSEVDYYNFEFADESKWQSYRLVSPDGEHALYGYAAKGSALSRKISPTDDAKVVSLTLALKFPTGANSNGQVEIDSLVNEGWVVEDDSK